MRAAFTIWENRIAPVFDVCRRIHIVDDAAGNAAMESAESFDGDNAVQRVLRLVDLEIETLVCGAISRPMLDMVKGYGIRVIPFVAGDLGEVISAWKKGALAGRAFRMPGCGGGQKSGHFRPQEIFREGGNMNGGKGGKRGSGQCQRQGQGQGTGQGQGRGRGGSGITQGPGGNCICPQCGYTEPHQQQAPCYDKKCPKCGAALTREIAK